MKLAKLSLAAIVAAGAMTTFASATPLEEAIQGVELNGMLRYRFYDQSEGAAVGGEGDNYYRLSSSFGFTLPIAENFTAKVGLSADHKDMTKSTSSSSTSLGYSTWDLTYKQADYSIKFGRQAINTPWTDPGFGGSKGTGLLGMYTGVEGWTFAAAGFASTDVADAGLDDAIYTEKTVGTKDTGVDHDSWSVTSNTIDKKDLYAAAAIGSVGPVNLQFWTSKMTDVVEAAYFAQADMAYEGFKVKAQVNQLELAQEPGDTEEDTGLFWGVEAGFGMEGFNVGAGYTQNDDEQGVYTLNADDAGMIRKGYQIYYRTVNAVDAEVMFVTAGYSFDNYRFNAGYVSAEGSNESFDDDLTATEMKKYEMDETFLEAGYKYSKKLDFLASYSMFEGDAADDDNDMFRFQAMYKF